MGVLGIHNNYLHVFPLSSSHLDSIHPARCSIDENKLELEMERSGKYSVSVMGSEVYKKLSLRPFIPKWMPATRKPIINVMIYDHTEGMDKVIS